MENEKTIKNGHLFVGVAHDIYNCEECKRPVISGAHYAKNMFAIMCPPDGSGFKTREALFAEKFANRYSGRESSYIMSKNQVKRFSKAILPLLPIYLEDCWDIFNTKEIQNENQNSVG